MADGIYFNPEAALPLLWSNSGTASFAAQTVTIDLSQYSKIIVKFKMRTSVSNYTEAIMDTNGNQYNTFMLSTVAGSGAASIVLRTATPNSSGVAFAEGITKSVTSTSSGTTNNDYMIPVAIYGIH